MQLLEIQKVNAIVGAVEDEIVCKGTKLDDFASRDERTFHLSSPPLSWSFQLAVQFTFRGQLSKIRRKHAPI